MKVSGTGPIQSKSVQKSQKKKSADGGAFAESLSGTSGEQQTSQVGSASPLASVNALLSLQEVPDSATGRSKGLARAEDMLDALEEIRRGILLGAVPVARLRSLAALARQSREAGIDQRLQGLLDDIELRAEVELAKLGL